MTILVTGGTGYIGSHTCVELLLAGHGVVILDNLCNSKASVVQRIADLGGACGEQAASLCFYEGDMRDRALLDGIFAAHKIDAVIHFAGLKAVAESVAKPLEYYRTNVGGTARGYTGEMQLPIAERRILVRIDLACGYSLLVIAYEWRVHPCAS